MRTLKKVLALVLAVCLLIGVPMSVDVAAVGKIDDQTFSLNQVLVIPESWGISTTRVPTNKGLLPYFTGGPIANCYHNKTDALPASNPLGLTLGQTLYSQISVTIVDANNWAFGDKTGNAIRWGVSMDVSSDVSQAPNNYFSKLTGSFDTSLLPDTLTAAQKAKYTTAIDTLDEIFMLAEDLGGYVQYRLWEKGNACTTNGLVECYYNSSTKVRLTGNLKVNASGIYNGGGANDIYDCAAVTVRRLGEDAVEMLSAQYIEDQGALRLSFTNTLHYSHRGNSYAMAAPVVLNGNGQLMYTNGTDYKTAKQVRDGGLSGYTALRYNTDMTFEQVIPQNRTVVVAYLNTTQKAKINELRDHVTALNQADPSGNYRLYYGIEDLNCQSSRGESGNNHYVDAVWSSDNRPLYANISNLSLGVTDMAAAPITFHDTDPDLNQPLTFEGVFINPKNDTQVILTFSEPIVYSTKLDVRMYPVDANLNSTINNDFPVWSYWWIEINGTYGKSGNQLIGTLKQPNKQENQRFRDITATYAVNDLRVAIWDDSWVKIPSNGYVDTIAAANGGKKLVAGKTAARDIAFASITQQTVSVERVKVLSDTTLEVTWSEGIAEGLYRNDATTWKAIRLTNDNLELQKDTAGSWLQYGGNWIATADPAVWHFVLYNGQSVSKLTNMIKPGGPYAGLKMTFAIEQKADYGDLTNVLDNITSVDGIRPVNATNDSANGWLDGSYTVIDLAPTPFVAMAVSDSQVRILTECAGTLGAQTVSIGGVSATSVVADSDISFIATFPAGTVHSGASVTVAANTFMGALGIGNAAVTLPCTSGFAAAGAMVTLDTNTTYSFMNADTGREISANGNTEFTATALGNNVYTFTVGDAYLDLLGGTAKLTDTPVSYQIKACDYDRFMIYAADGYAVCDTDAGTSTDPSLSLYTNDLLCCGWYLTRANMPKPLRILPIGDSITFGTNPDAAAPLMGWRDDLSKNLTSSLDRFVFVGNQVTYPVDVNSNILTRHEGNPGWTIKDHGERNGIYDLVPGLVGKYDPDVVCMMIGINDMAAYGGKNKWNNTIKAEIQANYTDLVAALTAEMDDTDTVFCSTLTPMTSAHSMAGMENCFNEMFPDFIEQLAKTYPQVKLNDNYAALAGKSGVVSSDGIHLSIHGDSFIAETYAASIMSTYTASGNKIGVSLSLAQQLAQATAGSTVTLTENYTLADGELLQVPAGITLNLNGQTVSADRVAVFGNVVDNSEGEGGIYIAKDETFLLRPDNASLPLYDTAFGGYRFFSATTTHRTPRSGENYVKFGFNMKLGSEKAYRLLNDAANANVSATILLEVAGHEPIHYTLTPAILAKYGNTVLGNMDHEQSYVVVLTVSGLDALPDGTMLSATPTLSSTTGVLRAGALQSFSTPSELFGTYSLLAENEGQYTEYSITLSADDVNIAVGQLDSWDTYLEITGMSPIEAEAEWEFYLADGSAFEIGGKRYVCGMGMGTAGAPTAMSQSSVTFNGFDPEDESPRTFTLTYTLDPQAGTLVLLTDQTGLLPVGQTFTRK